MKRLLLINNIPTPYRTFMFNKLSELGRQHGVELTVAFQALKEARRQWNPDEFDMQFAHFVSSGPRFWSRRPREFFTYGAINFDILRAASFGGFDYIICAPNMGLTNWLVSLLPVNGALRLLWSESNMDSTTHRTGLGARIKRLISDPYHVLLCPGRRAVEYLLHFNPSLADRPVIPFPNLVDNTFFRDGVANARARRAELRRDFGVGEHEMLIVCIGQLKPSKGFSYLIEAVSRTPGDYQVHLMGVGPEEQTWRSRLSALGIENRFKMLGSVAPDEVVRRFAAADWFLHPALFDPSPLVCIEAITAGMPVLISSYTGNAPEVVADGENGFSFDPKDDLSFDATLKRALQSSSSERSAFAAASLRRAEEYFDPDTVINRFYEQLQTHCRARETAAP